MKLKIDTIFSQFTLCYILCFTKLLFSTATGEEAAHRTEAKKKNTPFTSEAYIVAYM